MSLENEIIVVSGLPRSGTSLTMQMLQNGGIPVVTDFIREADTDNPRGYFEFEKVKKTREDSSWIPEARGKAVKLVSSLLYDLPNDERYRVIFMERDMDEMLASQEKMLARLGRPVIPPAQMKNSFSIHLKRLFEWLPQQKHLQFLKVSYNQLIGNPQSECERLARFLDSGVNTQAMINSIDPGLYRNRVKA